MVNLIAVVSKFGNLRFLWGFNRLRGSLVDGNYSGYSGPPHRKLIFAYILLPLLLSVNILLCICTDNY